MESFQKQIISVLIKYKWIILPLVPLAFFLFIVILALAPQNSTPTQNVPPTNLPTNPAEPTSEGESRSDAAREDKIDERTMGSAQKELLSDGSTKYTIPSSNPRRPAIIIAQKDGYPTFKRLVVPENHLLTLSSFTKLYGQPKWVFKSSEFYGPDIRTHIYPEMGFAIIANPQTDTVLEQHTFYPMKVEEYIAKYGEDIPAQP